MVGFVVLAVGIPGSEASCRDYWVFLLFVFCHSGQNAGPLHSIQNLIKFCVNVPSLDDCHDNTRWLRRSCNTVNYGDD